MTRTKEMERTEYSAEIERRAITLLRERSHEAEEMADFAMKALADAETELAYVQKANAWMVLAVSVLLFVIALMVKR